MAAGTGRIGELPLPLVNCDLCILAYQLYHQSVVWPLDPWYEVLARGGSDRRTSFMRGIHELVTALPARGAGFCYAGPAVLGAHGKSNAALDPVVTNLAQLRPREPAWTGDGALFIAMQAPAYVVGAIRRVSVCTHDGWRPAFPHGSATITPVHTYDDGQDDLIAFEGGTGSFHGSEAAWSLMGYVLKRTRRDGSYDAHIAFRGSRSGNASRALLKGGDGRFNGPEGNADWVTDLGTVAHQDDYVGGAAAEGFVAALKRCMGTVSAALHELHRRYGVPSSIQVTGHSLGAGLAALCCAAMTTGAPGLSLRKTLPAWPWDAVAGHLYAIPPIGARDFCTAFDTALAGRVSAPYVAGDPVVECSRTVSLRETSAMGFGGYLFGTGGYSPAALARMPRPAGADPAENSHEIYLIRAALLKKLADPMAPVPAAVKRATPWASFATFDDMLGGRAVTFVDGDLPTIVTADNLGATLVNYRFARHFDAFLAMLRKVVGSKEAYRGRHTAATYAEATERVALALDMCGKIESAERAVIADTVATQVAALCAFQAKKELTLRGTRVVAEGTGVAMEADDLLGIDFNARIGLGLILRALEDKPTTSIADYRRQPELKLCLEVFLGDAEAWQKKKSLAGRPV